VRGVIEIRLERIDVVEFKDRRERKFDACERFVRPSNRQPAPDARTTDHRHVAERGAPRIDQRTSIPDRHVRAESKQDDVGDQRRDLLGNLPPGW